MIEFMPESGGNVVGVKASGKLTDADYEQTLIPKLEAAFRQHGRLNLLFYMDRSFEGWSRDAAWDDASYGLRHRADFGRLAVVGGPAWVDWCIRLAGFLMKGEIRIFPADKLQVAWEWVRG